MLVNQLRTIFAYKKHGKAVKGLYLALQLNAIHQKKC